MPTVDVCRDLKQDWELSIRKKEILDLTIKIFSFINLAVSFEENSYLNIYKYFK